MEIKRQFQLIIDPDDDTPGETVEVAILRHRNMTMAVILPTSDVSRYGWKQVSSVVFLHPKDTDDDAVAEKYAMKRACGIGSSAWECDYSKQEAARRHRIYRAWRGMRTRTAVNVCPHREDRLVPCQACQEQAHKDELAEWADTIENDRKERNT